MFNCDVEFPSFSKLARLVGISDSSVGLINLEGFGAEMKLWKLDDVECLRGDGVEPSWSIMLAINVEFPCMPHSYYSSGYLVLLIDGPVWVWYNPDKKEATNLPIKKYWRQIFRYTESLVSIPGSKPVKLNALEVEDADEVEGEDEDQVEDEDQDGKGQ